MASESDVQGVLGAIDDFGSCLAAQDLGGTLALLADDPDVTVIPSEGVETHRGRAAVEAFFGRIYGTPKRYSWRGGIAGSRPAEPGHRSSPSAMSSSTSRTQNDASSPTA